MSTDEEILSLRQQVKAMQEVRELRVSVCIQYQVWGWWEWVHTPVVPGLEL